jgi:hypothetical protein
MAKHTGHRPVFVDWASQLFVRQALDQGPQAIELASVLLHVGTIEGYGCLPRPGSLGCPYLPFFSFLAARFSFRFFWAAFLEAFPPPLSLLAIGEIYRNPAWTGGRGSRRVAGFRPRSALRAPGCSPRGP